MTWPKPHIPTRVNVLGNDTDIDGDTLRVIAAHSPGGTVEINPDGTLTFTANGGFAGETTITYVISDGQGGSSIATVRVNVLDVVPPAADSARPADTPRAAQAAEPLAADGMVIDAVQRIGGPGRLIGDFGSHGIVVAAVNQVASLDGVSGSGYIGVVDGGSPINSNRIWEIQRSLGSAGLGFHRGDNTGMPEGLTGFSLRTSLLGHTIGDGSQTELIIQTLVRERMLMIQISNMAMDQAKTVSEYRVMLADGQPLPAWLDRPRGDLLIGERPVDSVSLRLKITVLYSDGSFETKLVEIQTGSGEIHPIEAKRGVDLPVPFVNQFALKTPPSDDGLDALARYLKAS
ncbi:MAG TPA: cadherin-like domain-containing protein [Hyphomicrobiaceae bacterium]|nr:cadherin-like domain-containing protein [Hyphomicrobiaceae bacterium]